MKLQLLTLSFGAALMIGCTSSTSEQDVPSSLVNEKETKSTDKQYPKALDYVFKAHGGINVWNGYKTLSYDMVKADKLEHQIVDLESRKVRIEQEKFTIGFNGQDVWVTQKDTNTFAGDARFYHNLYFYFFAMPFVLGDDGIVYDEVSPLEVDGATYPGIKISYNDGVGDSSKDNYFLYYNPKTYQAEWLGYTVTYFDGKPSQEIHYLNFEQWKNVQEIRLPEVLTWYKIDATTGEKTSRGSMRFENVKLNKESKEVQFYEQSKA